MPLVKLSTSIVTVAAGIALLSGQATAAGIASRPAGASSQVAMDSSHHHGGGGHHGGNGGRDSGHHGSSNRGRESGHHGDQQRSGRRDDNRSSHYSGQRDGKHNSSSRGSDRHGDSGRHYQTRNSDRGHSRGSDNRGRRGFHGDPGRGRRHGYYDRSRRFHYYTGYDPVGWVFAVHAGYYAPYGCRTVERVAYRYDGRVVYGAVECWDDWGYAYIVPGSEYVYRTY